MSIEKLIKLAQHLNYKHRLGMRRYADGGAPGSKQEADVISSKQEADENALIQAAKAAGNVVEQKGGTPGQAGLPHIILL